MLSCYAILLVIFRPVPVLSSLWSDLKLPHAHIPFFFYSNPAYRQACKDDFTCPYQSVSNEIRCWGYELGCPEGKRMLPTTCTETSRWARDKTLQRDQFWKSGDFGVVAEKLKLLEYICSPSDQGGSTLVCEENARFCHATNVFMDFTQVDFSGQKSYQDNLLRSGRLGGNCSLQKEAIKKWNMDHKHALQSWLPVVEDFTSVPDFAVDKQHCDVILDRPTFILQMDAVVNMFHHFCDFLNLYVSQHLNNSFSDDVNIVSWDTAGRPFNDPFEVMWEAFTQHPVQSLYDFQNKKVCFRDLVFALPPRQRLGLFYNMPLIDGCSGTGLFRAFNEHVLHRLQIPQKGPLKHKIRITLLSRETKFRNILNENEIYEYAALSGLERFSQQCS